MKLMHKIKDFLIQDVRNQNETNRTAVMIRLYSVIMWLYYLVLLGVFIFHGEIFIFDSAVPGLLLFSFIFYLTYKDKTKQAVALTHFTTVLWAGAMVVVCGWDCGVQHFLFALMMLGFTTSFARVRRKILYASGLCLMRLFMYMYTLYNGPLEFLSAGSGIVFQFINTIAVSAVIISSLSVYSNDSVAMEKKLVAYNEKLHRIALLDPLTGLLNRRGIMEYLEQKAEDYGRSNLRNLSLAIGDIDWFKKFNDTYGHECGDLVLRQLAVLMEKTLGAKGKAGRWGGEEFLIVFPNLNGDEAAGALEELQAKIRSQEIDYNGEKVSLTMTFGLVEYDYKKAIDHTIKEADDKLYMGKESGRNRVVF